MLGCLPVMAFSCRLPWTPVLRLNPLHDTTLFLRLRYTPSWLSGIVISCLLCQSVYHLITPNSSVILYPNQVHSDKLLRPCLHNCRSPEWRAGHSSQAHTMPVLSSGCLSPQHGKQHVDFLLSAAGKTVLKRGLKVMKLNKIKKSVMSNSEYHFLLWKSSPGSVVNFDLTDWSKPNLKLLHIFVYSGLLIGNLDLL